MSRFLQYCGRRGPVFKGNNQDLGYIVFLMYHCLTTPLQSLKFGIWPYYTEFILSSAALYRFPQNFGCLWSDVSSSSHRVFSSGSNFIAQMPYVFWNQQPMVCYRLLCMARKWTGSAVYVLHRTAKLFDSCNPCIKNSSIGTSGIHVVGIVILSFRDILQEIPAYCDIIFPFTLTTRPFHYIERPPLFYEAMSG